MGVYNDFTNKYRLIKTIRMELIPEENTRKNIQEIINEDERRSEKYKEAKKVIDKAHRAYIEKKLSNATLSKVNLGK